MKDYAPRAFVAVLLTVSSLVLVSAGCATRSQRTTADSHSVRPHHGRLELNGGKKWVVDKPMMAHIRKIENRVLETNRKPVEDHAALAAEIQGDLGRLVTNCTMQGKAHDELHKWLIPFLATAQEYNDATERAVQERQLGRIKQELLVFNEYFE